jgi:hypothetical protein
MIDYPTISILLTGIGMTIALTYYGLQIRNQNRARQAQLFMQMHNRWSNDLKGRDVNTIVNTKISGFDEYWEKYNSDEEFKGTMDALFGFYEGLGVIVKEGYMSIRHVALMWAGVTRRFYVNIVEQMIDGAIEYWNAPRVWSETVYLCKELIKYLEEHPELNA